MITPLGHAGNPHFKPPAAQRRPFELHPRETEGLTQEEAKRSRHSRCLRRGGGAYAEPPFFEPARLREVRKGSLLTVCLRGLRWALSCYMTDCQPCLSTVNR